MSTTFDFESEESDGLFMLATRAAAEAAGSENETVGRLEIVSTGGPDDAPPDLVVEAAIAYAGVRRVIDSIEVRHRCVGNPITDEVALDALRTFGGQKYTNLCADWPDEPGTEVDVTVCFFGKILPLASNTVLLPDVMTEEQARIGSEILGRLGVAHGSGGSALTPKHRQLRVKIPLESQIAAFRKALDAGLHASLYSSAIPHTQSTRIEQGAGADSRLDIFASRGVGTEEPCGTTDTDELQAFFVDHFGVRFGGRKWSVTNTAYEPTVEEVEPAPRRQPGIKFSFWVKGR